MQQHLHEFREIFANETLLCATIAWFAAQALKLPTYRMIEGRWDWHRFIGAGGMPSSHTSMVTALVIMVGTKLGWGTPEFGICVVLACIVMYDATGVRRETGHQSKVINEILAKIFVNGEPITNHELKELVGHTPLEVLMGMILGIIVACVYLALN